MAKSTERHRRERAAVAAATQEISRETLRKGKVVASVAPSIVPAIQRGEVKLDHVYRDIIGDERVGLYVRISPVARERLQAAARRYGLTMSETAEFVFTQIFGDGDGAAQ